MLDSIKYDTKAMRRKEVGSIVAAVFIEEVKAVSLLGAWQGLYLDKIDMDFFADLGQRQGLVTAEDLH